jgi:uncharacterized SAM-binding protein YcdF (DUF218 family)
MTQEIRSLHNWLAMADHHHYGQAHPSVVVHCGRSVLATVDIAAHAYLSSEPRPYVLVTGGVGHSTADLIGAAQRKFCNIDFSKCTAEADFFEHILRLHFGIPSENIVLERASTNCGANAEFSVPILLNLQQRNEWPTLNVILIQDPTMMRRSVASFQKYLKAQPARWHITPLSIDFDSFIDFKDEGIIQPKAYSRERYFDLLAGEIPRLRNDSQGYGPNGRGFIDPVDIPVEILRQHESLMTAIGTKTRAAL